MQDLSPTINRNSNILGQLPLEVIAPQQLVEQNITECRGANQAKEDQLMLDGALFAQYDGLGGQEKASSNQIELQNQPATSRNSQDDQQQSAKQLIMNQTDETNQQPISVPNEFENVQAPQENIGDDNSSVRSEDQPKSVQEVEACEMPSTQPRGFSNPVEASKAAEQCYNNDAEEQETSNKEDKDQLDQPQSPQEDHHSSSSLQNGPSTTLLPNQNCISSLQECLNEIMQKPRKDSTDIMKLQQQQVGEEGAAVKGGGPSEGGLAGKDTAPADDSSKGQAKKRMRKRLDKNGQQVVGDDQSESMYNNLKRAETKIYQEDKVRNEIECDISNGMYKANSLSLQKFQTQFTSTKVRGATRVNQNFAEDFGGFPEGIRNLEKQDSKSVVGQGQIVHQHRMGRWTKDEHFRFLVALKLYGKEWRKVQEHVITRTSTQARSHAQKFFQKLEKRNQILEEFLEALDVDNLEKHCIMSDLEEEGVPTGPRTKNKSKQRQGNRNNRNSTLLIPDVVPLKQRQQANAEGGDLAKHQTQPGQPQEKNYSDNAQSPQLHNQLNQARAKPDGTLEQETMKLVINDEQSSPANEMAQVNKSPVLAANNDNKSSSSKKEIENPIDFQSAQKSTSPQIQCEAKQGPKQLLAKRSNPQSAEQNVEFQQPLPKKSFQPTEKSSKNDSYIASDEKQHRLEANKNMRSHFEIQRRQQQYNHQSHSPNLQPTQLDATYNKPMDHDKMHQPQQNSFQMGGASGNSKPTEVRAPAIFTLGAAGGFGGTRQHSNSISLGTTRPQSSLIPHQKMNSNMVGGNNNGMQNNSQISAMTGVQNNINNQYPMTPNLRHSAASVMNHPMTGSVLDLQGQNYSILSQMSNAQYQQIKHGKDRPRANSFDEQFFNNILDKDDEIDEIDENQILPHIHTALVNRMVKDQMPIPASGVEAPYIGEADTLQQTHTRLNLTPKPKYPPIYSMMTAPPHSSAACQNTLGFDDGLARMRSNMRRVDSAEQFVLDNGNLVSRQDDPMKMDPAKQDPNGMLNEQHLISGADLGGVQLTQQPGVDMQALQSALSRQLPSSFLLQQGGNSVLDINPGISSLLQQNQIASTDLMSSLMQNSQQRQAAAAAAALIDPTGLQKQIMHLQQASSQQQVTAALMDQANAAMGHQQQNNMLHQQQLRALDLHQMQIKQVVNANLAVQQHQQQLAVAAASLGQSALNQSFQQPRQDNPLHGGTSGFPPVDTVSNIAQHMSPAPQAQHPGNGSQSQALQFANFQKHQQQQQQQHQQQIVMMKQMEQHQQQQNVERWKQQQLQHQQQQQLKFVDLTGQADPKEGLDLQEANCMDSGRGPMQMQQMMPQYPALMASNNK